MPKVPTSKSDSGSASGILNGSNHPNVLKRNQVRNNPLVHAKAEMVPYASSVCPHGVLTLSPAMPSDRVRLAFDRMPMRVLMHPRVSFCQTIPIVHSMKPAVLEPAKNRYEKLENRINELEAMLKESRVEIFFAFHPHAGRLFHGPSFMSSLTLPPTHPKFPSTAVLHAICAVGSLYTVAVVPTPQPNLNQVAPGGFCEFGPGYQPLRVPLDEIFNDRHKSENHVDSFAEQQVNFARQACDHQLSQGLRLLEIVQAQIICNWWYWGHAKWVELFMISAHALRTCVPLGLNTSTPFQSIADSLRAPTILPPPEDITEEEMRRNTFWLAYSMERQHGCSNGWALSLDESDVTQMLPVKGELFDFGTPATPDIRQWSHTKNVLLTHPDDQTDSFTLYIKGNMLLSRVKAYNLRFRSKRFKGDEDVAYDPSYANYWEPHHTAEGYPTKDLSTDPRRTPLFVEIDRIAMSFRASFPHHLRNPMPDGVVDSHLYTAHLIPHVAIILLHDPHAHVGSAGCMSAFKILEAARAVLDLIYAVQSTSYDITLLDYFCAFCWFMAGRVLVRFWHAAQEAKSEEQTITLRAEVEYIASAITKFGERIPLASRYSRMLNDIAYNTCGEKIYIQM
ncbi:hypothetical protein EWM64_g8842 [Hericium alpestre]|uniref:Xylanolytic transcriptional activator regulatory domain-containing protein n=1 Tax=Hericium alpestre TaxID=135208 RepID=A0A4Y9ZP12_9AGAM|nr:hypothetical protein EWM64_g8842 [Hericium alpestre]